MYAYLSLDALKARLDDTTTTDDATYRAVIEGVSREIDHLTARRFQPYTATLYYSADMIGRLWVDDLLSVTTLKTDSSGDRTYATTWATTDYDLEPFNAPQYREPYISIATAPNGTQALVSGARGVELAGIWGYWLETASVTTLGAAVSSTTATSITVASASNLDVLHTLLIDSEQLYVTGISGTTLTVERGVNGTTAATHLNAAAVSVYRYPRPVVEACAIQSARIFRRKEAPFGVQGSTEVGFMRVNQPFDPDAMLFLKPVRRIRFGAA